METLKDYCRDEGPRNVYWVVGFVREHLVIQGWLDLNEDIQMSKLWKYFGHQGLGK